MLKIGIIGYGFVGKACQKAFDTTKNSFLVIDPKENNYTVKDLEEFDPELTFICVPAPTLDDGTVDTTIIQQILADLSDIKHRGLVVLKSTVPPTQIDDLLNESYGLRLMYSPEFLSERSWEYDAVNPAMIIFGAREKEERAELREYYIGSSRVNLSVKFHNATLAEAAFIKYTINTFLAMKVVYFNQLQALYVDTFGDDGLKGNWRWFTETIADEPRMGATHMMVPGPDGKFGYGGTCFPKDVKAFLGTDKNERMTLLKEAELANTKIGLKGN